MSSGRCGESAFTCSWGSGLVPAVVWPKTVSISDAITTYTPYPTVKPTAADHHAFLLFLPFTHLMLGDGTSSTKSPNSLAKSFSEGGTNGAGDWLTMRGGPMFSPALGFGPDGRSGSSMLCMMESMSPVGVRLSCPT